MHNYHQQLLNLFNLFLLIKIQSTPGVDVICMQGFVWDKNLCKCITLTTTTACIDQSLCLRGFVWDPKECTCVASKTTLEKQTSTTTTMCSNMISCNQTDIWDQNLCKCVALTTTTAIKTSTACVNKFLCVRGLVCGIQKYVNVFLL